MANLLITCSGPGTRSTGYTKFHKALIRVGTSAFGLGNFTVPIDPKKRAFQDMWASTQVVVLPKV